MYHRVDNILSFADLPNVAVLCSNEDYDFLNTNIEVFILKC